MDSIRPSLWHAAARRSATPRLGGTLPWERGTAGVALGAILLHAESQTMPELCFDPHSAVSEEECTSAAISVAAPPMPGPIGIRRAAAADTSLHPDDAETNDFGKAVADWTSLIIDEVGLGNVSFGVTGDASFATVRDAISVLFAGKPVATLTKRCGSLTMYAKWGNGSGLKAFPIEEPVAYRYLIDSAGVAATRGASFRGAVAFALGYFKLVGASEFLDSRRCIGAMHVGLGTLKEREQCQPLTTKMVADLERAVVRTTDPDFAIFGGFVLFCLHGRLRVGNAIRARREPFLEGSGDDTFVQTATYSHKTAARSSRRLLPLVALGLGIAGAPWAQAWLAARRERGLDAKRDACL